MTPYICPLASGSLGNALLVASAKARVLVDMGLSQRGLRAGLREAGVAPGDVGAVLLTHTHRDHFSAAAVSFCLAHHTPVYSTQENLEHLSATLTGFRRLGGAGLAREIDGGPVEIGDLAVEAFDVPHDSEGGCLGFRLSVGGPRRRRVVAVATDLGHVPTDTVEAFIDADAVVLESNHDPDMLRESGRPWDLIERIAGDFGHLSNESCADALVEIVGRSHPGRVKAVVLAHLSRDCNTPELALDAQAHLARHRAHPLRIAAASQYETGPRIEL